MLNIFEGVGFSDVTLINEAPTITNETRNLKIPRWRDTAQRWRLEFETVPLEPADYRRVFFALVNAQNKARSFDFIHPLFSYGQGHPGDAVNVRSPAKAGALVVSIRGLPANRKGAFLSGDPIRFTGHKKVYFVDGDVNADADGNALITLNTNLQADLNLAEKAEVNEVAFYLQLDGEPLEIEINNGNKRLLQLSFEAVEDLTQ